MSERTPISLWSPRSLATLAAFASLIGILLYLSGTLDFHKVKPGSVPAPAWVIEGTVSKVEQRPVVETVSWPGAVSSRLVGHVAAKVIARVEDVGVQLGEPVERGQVLVRLDDREIRARADQARAALAAAEAEAQHAHIELRRIRALFEREAATKQERDAAEARARAAEAARGRARQALAEAESVLADTQVLAPFSGVVAARFVDPGDLATPGRPLVIVHDPSALRFEAHVAEGAGARLRVADKLTIRIHNPPLQLDGQIEEIAPRAEPSTRTILIKLSLPQEAKLLPGAYGTLEVPVGTRMATLAPAGAVVRRGQLEMVYVRENSRAVLRLVRTGKQYGDWIEILSGLEPGTEVYLPLRRNGEEHEG